MVVVIIFIGPFRRKYQSERLSDSSRWSKHCGDHGTTENEEHPGRVLEKGGGTPPGVRYNNTLGSGGLRFAQTTGYFRSNPPGLSALLVAASYVFQSRLNLMKCFRFMNPLPISC